MVGAASTAGAAAGAEGRVRAVRWWWAPGWGRRSGVEVAWSALRGVGWRVRRNWMGDEEEWKVMEQSWVEVWQRGRTKFAPERRKEGRGGPTRGLERSRVAERGGMAVAEG